MNRCRPGEIAVWQTILTKDAFGAVAMGIALAYTNTYGGTLYAAKDKLAKLETETCAEMGKCQLAGAKSADPELTPDSRSKQPQIQTLDHLNK